MRRFSYLILSLLFTQIAFSQYNKYLINNEIPFYHSGTRWADSTLQQMSVDERIGQLFMVATYSTNDKQNNKTQIENLIKKYHIGGLIFMQGTAVRQIQLINHYQQLSQTPLLIGMDLENGLAFRLKGTEKFPRNMTLGAITDENLVYETAREIARQCKRVGVHVNFAPVLDVNNNRKNPVIGTRSFGEDRENVVEKGYAFVRGLQDENIIAVGKHFPGHGDTKVDSHQSLPRLDFSINRLDSLELYPFQMLSNYGISGMMTAHLQVPSIDAKHPTSLSKKAVNLLRNTIGFKGLIFTDALNMGGVANSNAVGEVDLRALLAGNDVLLFSQNVPKAVQKIKQALKSGKITQKEIDSHVRKILLAKSWVGLQNWQPISTAHLSEDLHTTQSQVLQEKLAKASITLVKNEENILPLQNLEKRKVAAITFGVSKDNAFLEKLTHYTDVTTFTIPKGASPATLNNFFERLQKFNTIIVGKFNTNYSSRRKFGATQNSINFLQKLNKNKDVIFTFFGSPYGVSYYDLNNCKAVLIAYEQNKNFQNAAAEAIFGGSAITGKLSFGINNLYPANWGIRTEKVRLGYTSPENEKFNPVALQTVDSIINDAIKRRAMPSCQFLLAKNGNIIYNKAYGYQTFNKQQKTKTTDIYDLASITKVSATLPLIMQQYDRGLLRLETKLSEMLPYFQNTDKANITLEDLLTHESGLPSWIPLYRILIASASYGKKLISYRRDKNFPIQIDNQAWLYKNFRYQKGLFNSTRGVPVGKNLFLTNSIRPILFDTIAKAELRKPKKYRYSDLGFVLCGEYLKDNADFANSLDVFYKKLGATTTGMQPNRKFSKNKIIPTAKENFLRKALLRGYVHDPNAALLGGVAGHAGLFSNAEDLAKVWQMYLQKGMYGGEQFIQPSTLALFTKQAHPAISRRGIGFDKPDADTTKMTSFSKILPLSTFGHTGFTGTMVWADPENQIIGIILANRVYPHDWNKEMMNLDVRTKIQEAVYEGLRKEQTVIIPLAIE